jgi:hypothetical protein
MPHEIPNEKMNAGKSVLPLYINQIGIGIVFFSEYVFKNKINLLPLVFKNSMKNILLFGNRRLKKMLI